MYCNFFGFSEKPFDVTPDPKFLYLSPGHREMLASLTYGIQQRRGFITIVGEVGTGKTTLLNTVRDRLNENTKVAFIFNTDVTFDQMLHMALVDLRLAEPEEILSKVQALHRLSDFSIRQLARGGNVVLIVDEAQNLDRRSMENLRLVSNLETHKRKLIQIVLSGQPELDVKLSQPELRQLAQRISLRRYIIPLSEKETYEYIQHRLAISDYQGPSLFSRRAQQLIWEYSGGVPRKINILCDNALLIGYGLRKWRIKPRVVEEAIKDLGWSPFSGTIETRAAIPMQEQAPELIGRASHSWFALTASLVLAACLVFLGGLLLGRAGLNFKGAGPIPISTTTRAELTPGESTEEAGVHLAAEEETTKIAHASKVPGASPGAVVKKGDSLSKIIIQAYGRYDGAILNAVLQENPEIEDPNQITVGQEIKLPEFN